jgi:hypothetical protein
MKAWAGGGQLSVARPPRPRCSLAEGAKPGLSDTRYKQKKKIVNVRSRKSTAYTLQSFFEGVTDIKHF